ncbi:MAG: tetratricopeptide repeat protein [Anaerolineae bacterium]|nr:tetratricopeptide repeat protein [Anaerolineae bacterium]
MNNICPKCGSSNPADREYCSSCHTPLIRSPRVLREAWEAARLRKTLGGSGMWSILWGIMGVITGVALLEASDLNIILIGIGLFLIGTGIAAWAAPNPVTLRLDAAALLLVGIWNIVVTIAEGDSSQFAWAIAGIVQIVWAIQRFRKHGDFVRVQHIPKSLAREAEALVNSTQRVKADKDKDIVAFRANNKLWQARLMPDLVVAVAGTGNAQEVRFVLPDELELQITGEAQGRQWPPAAIRLENDRWSGSVSPISLEHYGAWQAARSGVIAEPAPVSAPAFAVDKETPAAPVLETAEEMPATRVTPAPAFAADKETPAAPALETAEEMPAALVSAFAADEETPAAPALQVAEEMPATRVTPAPVVSARAGAATGKAARRPRWLRWAAIGIILIVAGALAYWNIGLSIYNRGVGAHNNLDAETAILRYEQVMRYYPAFLGSFARLAAQNHPPCVLYRQGHQAYVDQTYESACGYYAQFIAQYPRDRLTVLVHQEYPAAYLAWAQEAAQQSDYLSAADHYRNVIELYPDSPQAADAIAALPATYCAYGDARIVTEDYGAAIEAYQNALAAAPQAGAYPQARQGLWETYQKWGSALLAAGEYEMALARYQDALAVGDEDKAPLVWPAIGQVYLAWAEEIRAGGDEQQAVEIGIAALEAFPDSDWRDDMLAFVGDTYARWADEQCLAGQYRAALDIYALALQTFPDQDLSVDIHALSQNAYLRWARALSGEQEFAQAIDVYRALIEAYPDAATTIDNEVILTHYTWARSLLDAQDYQAAAAVYEGLIKSYPAHSMAQKAQQNLSQVHYDWAVDADGQKDLGTAVAHYETCIALEETRLSISKPQSKPAPPTYTITVNTDSLNVRRGPNADQAVVGVAKRDQTLMALGRSQDSQWIKVKDPDGWVFASLVTIETPLADMVVFDPAATAQPEAAIKPAVVEQSALAARAWEAVARAMYRWGIDLYDAQDYENAALKFKTVIDEYALSQAITDTRGAAARTYLAWGDVLSSTAQYEDAVDAYDYAKLVDPLGEYAGQATDSAAAVYLAWADSLYAAKTYSSAISKYALVYTNYPASVHVNAAYQGVIACYNDWADALRQQGKYDDAIAKYQAIITGFPSSPSAGAARIAIGKTYNLWGASLHTQKKYGDAMAKFAQAWQATSDADVVAAAQKGYNDALWAIARLTDATGKAIIDAALTTACQGQAAASPAVGLAAEEAGKARCNKTLFSLPADLSATMPAHFRYAVCVTSGANELQRCSYTGGRTLVRQQIWWKVTVRNAKTGAWITENTFYGSTPGSCPFSRYFSRTVDYMSGGSPSADSAINWLRGVIK